MSVLSALSLMIVAAWGVPMVHDGGSGSTLALTVSERTGLPPEQLEPTDLSTLLKLTPRVLGAATLRHCAATATRVAELRASAVRAEASFRSGELPAALDELDLGIAGLGCLVERVEAPTATRLFLLRGALFAGRGELEAAREELRTALSFTPTMVYETWLPPEGAALTDELRAEVPALILQVSPAGVGPNLDGQTVGAMASLRPGLHLLQIPSTAGLQSAWLTIAGEARLVVPGSFRRPILESLESPEARPEVEQLLRATLGEQPVYVASGGGVWLVGPEGTETLIAPPRKEEVTRKPRR